MLVGQIVKQSAQRRVVDVVQRIIRGTPEAIAAALAATGGTQINAAYIERLNAPSVARWLRWRAGDGRYRRVGMTPCAAAYRSPSSCHIH